MPIAAIRLNIDVISDFNVNSSHLVWNLLHILAFMATRKWLTNCCNLGIWIVSLNLLHKINVSIYKIWVARVRQCWIVVWAQSNYHNIWLVVLWIPIRIRNICQSSIVVDRHWINTGGIFIAIISDHTFAAPTCHHKLCVNSLCNQSSITIQNIFCLSRKWAWTSTLHTVCTWDWVSDDKQLCFFIVTASLVLIRGNFAVLWAYISKGQRPKTCFGNFGKRNFINFSNYCIKWKIYSLCLFVYLIFGNKVAINFNSEVVIVTWCYLQVDIRCGA